MREHWAVASLTKTKFNQHSRDSMTKCIKWRWKFLRVEFISCRTRWLTGSKTVFPSVLCMAWLGINKYTFDFLSFPNHSTVTVNFCLSVNTRKCCPLFRLRECLKGKPLNDRRFGPQAMINSPLIILWLITRVVWSTFVLSLNFARGSPNWTLEFASRLRNVFSISDSSLWRSSCCWLTGPRFEIHAAEIISQPTSPGTGPRFKGILMCIT